MRDIITLAFMFLLVPLAIGNAFNAYLLWGWMGLIALNGYLYGMAESIPYVMVFAIIAMGLLIFRKEKDHQLYKPNAAIILFIAFSVHGLLSASFAYDGLNRNWELFFNMFKTLTYCLLMPLMATSRVRIYALVLMLAIGISFHGLLDGLKFIASGANYAAHGIAKFGDNNHYAVVMVMILPILLYIYQYTANKMVKIGSLFTIILVSLTVISTNSRGGLLSLGVMAFWLVMTSRQKAKGLIAMAALAAIMATLAPESWYARMNTIQDANQDVSFMGRVTAWKRASAIAVKNPIFGGGYHAGQAVSTFNEFRYQDGLLGFIKTPDIPYPAATHSIYFEVLGDLGFVGLALFIGIFSNAIFMALKIKEAAKKIGSSVFWASDLANYIAASIVAYLVGGAALSAAYFELPYIMVALLTTLYIHVTINGMSKIDIELNKRK